MQLPWWPIATGTPRIDPWALLQPWMSLQQLWWQTAWAAPQVIAMRMADLGVSPLTWDERQRREATRMVLEKAGAFGAGLWAAGRVLGATSPIDPSLGLRLAAAGLHPAHRSVGANLNRLRGRARRAAPHRR